MTLSQETRRAYSTMLPSPHGAPSTNHVGFILSKLNTTTTNNNIKP